MTGQVRKHRVDLGTWDTSMYRGGDGPGLLYLHGMLGNPGWHPFIQTLARHWTVSAPCLPGFNDAGAPGILRNIHDWTFALSEIVDAAGLSGLPVVAGSVGAMVALELEAIRPGTFGPMTLISPLGIWDDASPVADVFSERTGDQPAFLMASPQNASIFYDNAHYDDAGAAELQRYRTRRSAASLVWPLPDHGLASRIHRIGQDVFLVWGAEDRMLPASYRDMFSAHLGTVVGSTVVDGAAHLAEWDRPHEVAALVQQSFGARRLETAAQ